MTKSTTHIGRRIASLRVEADRDGMPRFLPVFCAETHEYLLLEIGVYPEVNYTLVIDRGRLHAQADSWRFQDGALVCAGIRRRGPSVPITEMPCDVVIATGRAFAHFANRYATRPARRPLH